MNDETTAAAAPGYPLRYDVEYPEELSRWLIFVKWLLAIPHTIILYALSIAAVVIGFVAFFAILFTKRYPQGLFDFVVNVNRWGANVGAYTGLFRDEYPPFSWEPGQYAATYEVDYPEELNRWLPLIKWLLAVRLIEVILFVVVIFIAVAIDAAAGSTPVLTVLAFLGWLIFVLVLWAQGLSPGKMILGMRVIDTGGEPAGFWKMALREVIGKFVSSIVFYLGYFWIIWDKYQQGWHDKIADTVVIAER